jgi:hypothetical protein
MTYIPIKWWSSAAAEKIELTSSESYGLLRVCDIHEACHHIGEDDD